MSPSSSPRPRQVTMAGGFAIGGSVFLLFVVFDTLGRLSSVDMREQVTEALESGSVQALDLSVGQALAVMRGALSVAAVCAAIAGVAGVFLFQRHHGARIALTVAAVPLLLTAPFTGGLLAVLVVAAAGLAWSGPARDWFAGRPVREQPERRPARHSGRDDEGTSAGRGDVRPGDAEQPRLSTSTASTAPAPTQGYGAATTTAAPAPDDPTAPGGPWSSTAPVADRPPAPVRVACLLTWVSSVLVAVVALALITVYQVQRDALQPEIYRQAGLDERAVPPELLTPTLWATALVFAGWAVGACVLAFFVRRRHDWARYLLIISAAVAGALCLLGFPVGLPSALAAFVAIGLLLRPESRAWFAGRPPQTPQPPSQPSQQPSSQAPSQEPPSKPGPW